MPTRPPLLALCGTSTSSPREDEWGEAIGRLCAERGAVALCGGLGGIMASAAKGVVEAGGVCIGLLPGSNTDDANQYLSYAIPTGLGEMRNGLLARATSGMVAIGGGYGTLSEIAFARRLGKPVATLSSWQVDHPTEEEADPGLYRASKPEEAMEWLWTRLGHAGVTA